MPKKHKQAEAKTDNVINPQNYNFNQFFILTSSVHLYIHVMLHVSEKSSTVT